jgi:hypothetical protein
VFLRLRESNLGLSRRALTYPTIVGDQIRTGRRQDRMTWNWSCVMRAFGP